MAVLPDSYTPYRPALGLIGTGAILWIIGVLLSHFIPALPPIGAVLVLFGQVLFWIGVAVLVIQLIIALVKGLP
jgi:hypothetical protein